MDLLVVLLSIFILFALHLLFRRLADEMRSPRLERVSLPAKERDSWPQVSVVVPARNEEKHLAGCLASLSALEYPCLEVLVVNDRSTDRTGEIAARLAHDDPRIKVIEGKETPQGWTGKNFAIHQGAQQAVGEYLLIVDADTTLHPETLERTITTMQQEEIDLLTLFPRVVCASFWEKTLLPWLGLLSTFRMDRVNDPSRKEAMAFGYFLLFRRKAFDQVGGYEGIRERVGEDWIIAQRVKQRGLCLRMLLGTRFVTKRFGPSCAEIWQGFTKNFILIMEGRKILALLAIPLMFYYLLFTVFPWMVLIGSPMVLLFAGWDPVVLLLFLLAFSQVMVLLSVGALMRYYLLLEAPSPLLQPLGGLVISAMGFTAIFRTISGQGISWKGRTYRHF